MIRLAVRVPRQRAELVLAELLDLAPAGVEEVDVEGGCVEYAVYGAPGELPSLPQLRAAVGGALVEVTTRDVADDWAERWRQFHRPVRVRSLASDSVNGGNVPVLCIRPPWEEMHADVAAGPVEEIVIDPGQAFGTGGHATTQLCLELLLELAATRGAASRRTPAGGGGLGALLDVGTGSGVIAIAAARLGFGPVLGVDNERESVRAAAENALVNGVQIQVSRLDVRAQPLPWIGGDDRPCGPLIVAANLVRGLLLELAGSLAGAPDHLLASGMLVHEVDEVAAGFAARLGLHERARRERDGWAAAWLVRP